MIMLTDNIYRGLSKLIKSRVYSAWQMLHFGDFEYRSYRNMQFLIATAALHKQTFSQFRNFHINDDVAVVACGPSLEDYKPIEGVFHIGVNKALLAKNITFDYWFCEDIFGATDEYKEFIRNYHPETCKKFYGLSNIEDRRCSTPTYDPSCRQIALTPNAFQYRHELGTGIKGWESEFAYDLSTQPLGSFGTVAFSALQFALWTNPKRLFLVGCDCTNAGHFYKKENKFNLNLEKVLAGYKKLKVFAEHFYPETEIVSVNPVGLKGLFKDWDQNNEPLP